MATAIRQPKGVCNLKICSPEAINPLAHWRMDDKRRFRGEDRREPLSSRPPRMICPRPDGLAFHPNCSRLRPSLSCSTPCQRRRHVVGPGQRRTPPSMVIRRSNRPTRASPVLHRRHEARSEQSMRQPAGLSGCARGSCTTKVTRHIVCVRSTSNAAVR